MTKLNKPGDDIAQAGTSRRDLLKGLGIGVGAGVASVIGAGQVAAAPMVGDAPKADADTSAQRVPFYGAHQAGIVNPRPAAGIIASFDIVATDLDQFETMMKLLTARIAFLTAGGAVAMRDPKLPPEDSGILGPDIAPDNLTVTVGLGDSFFEKTDWGKALKPNALDRMTQFPNDALDAALCHGDLSLQFCANTPDTAIHALRDIMKSLSEYLVMNWMMPGDVPQAKPAADGTTPSARNLLGFRDGSGNPDSTDEAKMRQVVWVTPENGEPGWALGGSYQVVRLIRNMVERWDRTPLQEQERDFGRRKISGAPLDGGPNATERDVPDYSKDPEGKVTSFLSHIRRANPRTPETEANLILRRPFNYTSGALKNGQIDQGLIFICYQADLGMGFITVQSRLNGEAMEEYFKPFGGGYFFVLPGVSGPGDYLGSTLVSAARSL
ncbi:iron uptake transporter deferrochelatase/peroxidase subunit [Paenirhodobacter enshiensis]|uniref:iron uptake transporter deferrochelatase/peroxidase subunit n=1 Tax=Paenirhodobacter enshiensis TaxID=1105367 RepID=UPI0035B44D04